MPRKCYLCGRYYYSPYNSLCGHCHVRLTWLDNFRFWRQLRRWLTR